MFGRRCVTIIYMKNNNLLVHTSWGNFALFILLPAYVLLLDFLASVITHSNDESVGFLWGAIMLAIVCFIFGTRFLKLSEDNIAYWPHFVIGKKIPIQNIAQIDLRVAVKYNRYGGFPAGTLYFLGGDQKVLGKLLTSTFSKNDIALFLKTISTNHPQIKLNDKAEAYSKGDDALLRKEMNQVYKNVLWAALILLIVILVFAGIVWMFKR